MIDAQLKKNEAYYDINCTFSVEEEKMLVSQAKKIIDFVLDYFNDE